MFIFPIGFFSNSVTGSSEELFSFTSFTFTNAGSVGGEGPTLANCLSSYDTNAYPWLNNTNYFNVTTQGVQQWKVPVTADYTIEVAGARGGVNIQATPWISGGYGAVIKTRVSLTKNDVLSIVVGQMGSNRGSGPAGNYCGASGGGGTFVYNSSSIAYLAVAGGGGGGASTRTNLLTNFLSASGKHDSTSGTTIQIANGNSAAGGTNGNGGFRSSRGILFAGPGAGISGSGQTCNGGQGRSRTENWVGGWILSNSTYRLSGGFGGGGGSGDATNNASYAGYSWAGGGGGYSGGGGGGNGGAGDGQYGGGGGSFYIGTFQTGSTGTNNGHGYVTITKT